MPKLPFAGAPMFRLGLERLLLAFVRVDCLQARCSGRLRMYSELHQSRYEWEAQAVSDYVLRVTGGLVGPLH